MRVGIVGLGNFGRFATSTLAKDGSLDVVAYDTSDVPAPEGVAKTELADVAASDAVILCVPLAAYDEVLAQLRPQIKSETLVVDICSVKVEAEKRLRVGLPGHRNLLITHPMFGPQSAKDGIAGLTLVVTGAEGEGAEAAIRYCQDALKLKIMRMTSEEHDREMASVHALTFFIARALTDMHVQASPFQPPSYQWLLDLSYLDKHHTEELFLTMEVGNPYARVTREKFLKTLQEINDRLDKENV